MGIYLMPSVLFICVANSCRSQMAEAITKKDAQGQGWEVWSSGSHPSGRVHPVAMNAMKELGIDLSAHYSKGLDQVPQQVWDYVVTMGCGDNCPAVRAKRRIDWQIPDPVSMPPEEARKVRDQIISLVRALIASHPA